MGNAIGPAKAELPTSSLTKNIPPPAVDTLAKVEDTARDLGQKLEGIYENAWSGVKTAGQDAQKWIQKRPVAALFGAVGVGAVIGFFLAGKGRKKSSRIF